ncbi:MAG: hypothetical protein ABI741_12060 [Ferruginibacter sp.]
MIILVLLSWAGNIACAQEPDCYPFKEGKFRINDSRAGGVIIAERKGGFQTQTMEVLKAVVRFKISWENNCSYTLTLDKVIRNENKVPFPPGMVIHVKIVAVKDNTSYTQETTSSVTNGSYRLEVTKIQ